MHNTLTAGTVVGTEFLHISCVHRQVHSRTGTENTQATFSINIYRTAVGIYISAYGLWKTYDLNTKRKNYEINDICEKKIIQRVLKIQ